MVPSRKLPGLSFLLWELKVSFIYVLVFPETRAFPRCSGRSEGRTKAQSHMTNAKEKKKVSIALCIPNATMAGFLSEATCAFRVRTADRGAAVRWQQQGGCWSDKGDWLRSKSFN